MPTTSRSAFGASGFEVTDVADVEQIEDSVGEYYFATGAAMLFEDGGQSLA